MLLKKGLRIKDAGDSFEFDFSNSKIGKVTSRMLPILLGENKFQSIGYGILDRAKMLGFSEIEQWYMARGSIAEHLVLEYLKAFYKATKGIEVDLKAFEISDYEGYDMFNESYKYGSKKFGGTPDIAITNPLEHRATVEVKSKNVKHYEYIVNRKIIPVDELRQGEQLAYLSKASSLIMAYVFFTDDQETQIKNILKTDNKAVSNGNYDGEALANLLDFNYKNVIIKISFNKVDRDRIEGLMDYAYETLHSTIESSLVPKEYFSKKEIIILEEYIEKGNEINEDTMFESF